MCFNCQNHKILTIRECSSKYLNVVLNMVVVSCAIPYLLTILEKLNTTQNILALWYFMSQYQCQVCVLI